MSNRAPQPLTIHPPSEAAAALGLRVPDLVALLRRYRYGFTEIKPGGKPGDRGRNRWGLTDEQLRAILTGQRREFREPEPAATTGTSAASPDGKSRIPRRGRARM